jgi:hypothetical protein
MTKSHFERFLAEATVPDETQGSLGPDCLYGVYHGAGSRRLHPGKLSRRFLTTSSELES